MVKGNFDAAFLYDRLSQIVRPDIWKALNRLASDNGGVYVVGGILRDIIYEETWKLPNPRYEHVKPYLRKSSRGKAHKLDLDIIIPEYMFNQLMASLCKPKRIVRLSKDFLSYRLCYDRLHIDVTSYYDISKDLSRRDFRLNALALRLGDNPELLDPFNGIRDIMVGRLALISEKNLRDDPVRIIRAMRMLSKYPFFISDDELGALRRYSELIPTVNKTRLYQEILKWMAEPMVYRSLDYISLIGLDVLLLGRRLDEDEREELKREVIGLLGEPVEVMLVLLTKAMNDLERLELRRFATRFKRQVIRSEERALLLDLMPKRYLRKLRSLKLLERTIAKRISEDGPVDFDSFLRLFNASLEEDLEVSCDLGEPFDGGVAGILEGLVKLSSDRRCLTVLTSRLSEYFDEEVKDYLLKYIAWVKVERKRVDLFDRESYLNFLLNLWRRVAYIRRHRRDTERKLKILAEGGNANDTR